MMWLALALTEASAQKTIHWLLYIDTKDENVGELDVNGREYLRKQFVNPINAALSGEYQTDIKDNYGDNCSPYKCKNDIQSLQCSPQDIVVFYYIGHGGRSVRTNSNEHPWPKMWFHQDDPEKMIDLGWVNDQLKAKNPRLLLTIGMCCNGKQNLPATLTPTFSGPDDDESYEFSPEERQYVKNIFINTCGNLIATSASPGQLSGGGETNFAPPMDYYTAFLCSNFNELVYDRQLDLTGLFKKTSNELNRATENEQTPIYKSDLSTGTCTSTPPSSPCRQMPSTVNVNDMTDLEGLMEAIICNKKDMPNRGSYFASDCIVRVMGQDGKTQVDRLGIDNYMLRARTNSSLLRVVPIATSVSGGKITNFFVREYYVR